MASQQGAARETRREQRLEPLSDSRCRYTTTDAFAGILTPLVVLSVRRTDSPRFQRDGCGAEGARGSGSSLIARFSDGRTALRPQGYCGRRGGPGVDCLDAGVSKPLLALRSRRSIGGGSPCRRAYSPEGDGREALPRRRFTSMIAAHASASEAVQSSTRSSKTSSRMF